MKFIIVDKASDGRYFIADNEDRYESLSEALDVATRIKYREGGIIANRASVEHRTHNQMSSPDRNVNQ